ncbi:MAG TPA: alcohol dehydrogenase [Bacteroidetes bacterium]|nr:alcohol dehydrogenase [Bacteroidota bacterium]
MIALEYQRPRKLYLIDKPIPIPGENEVLIKVKYAGICGTDLHILNEEAPAHSKVILGHEFSGIIEKVGRNVNHLKIGSPVTADPNNYCGYCLYCKRGEINFCKNLQPVGVFRDGAWAQYCVVPKNQVYPLTEKIPLEWGALTEPLSCIIHGWDRLHPLPDNPKVLILGSGIIGLLWGIWLTNRGLTNFIFSEPSDIRQQIARNLNFQVFSPREIPQINKSFDIIIDCSGNPNAIQQAFQWINPLGKFLLFGVCPMNSTVTIEPFVIFKKELTIMGSIINPFTFSRAIEFLKKINIPLSKLGVKFFTLKEHALALQMAEYGKITKGMFQPDL